MCDTSKTLIEAVKFFSDIDACYQYMVGVKWPDGKIVCPKSGRDNVGQIETRKMLKCRACKKQFSYKIGTIFAESRSVSML